MSSHYIVCRYEHGFGTGPGNGYQAPDEVQVMAAAETERGAKAKQRRLGGFIRIVPEPIREYSHNECIETKY